MSGDGLLDGALLVVEGGGGGVEGVQLLTAGVLEGARMASQPVGGDHLRDATVDQRHADTNAAVQTHGRGGGRGGGERSWRERMKEAEKGDEDEDDVW